MAYNSKYRGAQIDQAVGAVLDNSAAWDGKQDALQGTPGEYLGFDAAGTPQSMAIPAPDVSGEIAAHNQDGAAHSDIRSQVGELSSLLVSYQTKGGVTVAGGCGWRLDMTVEPVRLTDLYVRFQDSAGAVTIRKAVGGIVCPSYVNLLLETPMTFTEATGGVNTFGVYAAVGGETNKLHQLCCYGTTLMLYDANSRVAANASITPGIGLSPVAKTAVNLSSAVTYTDVARVECRGNFTALALNPPAIAATLS